VNISAPTELALAGTSGSVKRTPRTGYSGTVTTKPFGLVPANVTSTHLVGSDAGFNQAAPAASATVAKVTVTVPPGSKVARFATFAADYPTGTDLDMFVYQGGTTTLVGSSARGDANESVSVTAAGTYDVYVVQFSLAAGVMEQDVKTNAFVVGTGTVGNLSVTPASQKATFAGPAPFTATWTGLTAGTRYLGVIEFGNGSTVIGQTVVQVAT
jgi:hypothetical protein